MGTDPSPKPETPAADPPAPADPPVEEKVNRLEQAVESVRSTVADLAQKITGKAPEAPPEAKADPKPEAPAGPVPLRQVEADSKASVEAALAQIIERKEDKATLDALKKTVLERPPREISRLAKAVWGKDAFEL